MEEIGLSKNYCGQLMIGQISPNSRFKTFIHALEENRCIMHVCFGREKKVHVLCMYIANSVMWQLVHEAHWAGLK